MCLFSWMSHEPGPSRKPARAICAKVVPRQEAKRVERPRGRSASGSLCSPRRRRRRRPRVRRRSNRHSQDRPRRAGRPLAATSSYRSRAWPRPQGLPKRCSKRVERCRRCLVLPAQMQTQPCRCAGDAWASLELGLVGKTWRPRGSRNR